MSRHWPKSTVCTTLPAIFRFSGDMMSGGGEDPKASVQVSVGKEIDAALGDVLRGLLSNPAAAMGNLVADGIGILGDWVRRKREVNTQFGMVAVRKKLEANGIDIKDITPPKEEQLHLLINGMSLADDKSVRNMWAGLFAEALDPTSDVAAERPFISVLESLSSTDAKVIDFLAFTIKTDRDLRHAEIFRPKNTAKVTAEEADQLDKIRAGAAARRDEAIKAIERKATEHGIYELSDGGWADNLVRQGIIERIPTPPALSGPVTVRSLDERGLATIVGHVNKQIENVYRSSVRASSTPNKLIDTRGFGPQIKLEARLTSFGERLAEACGLM